MHLRRLLASGATAVLAIGLLPSAALAATSTANVCPPPGKTQADRFGDDDGNVHEDNIDCMAQYGIAKGTSANTYSPGATVTRAQMATFIANLVRTAGADLPAGSDAFTDDDGNIHEGDVNALAAAGIVKGTGDGTTYSPGAQVTRAAMATFVANALAYVTGSSLPAGQDAFTDDDGNIHEGNINAIAGQGVVSGTGPTTYSPSNPVIRAQMASFVMQGAAYLDQQGAWGPTQSGAVDVLPPELTSVIPTDAGLPGVLDDGDQILMTFDEVVQAANDAGVDVAGATGALTSLLGGGSAVITQPQPDQLLVTVQSLGSSLPAPVTLDALSGVTDAAGNPAGLGSWAGTTIIEAVTGGGGGGGGTDVVPPSITAILPTDTTLPGILDTGDKILVTFDETVTAATGARLGSERRRRWPGEPHLGRQHLGDAAAARPGAVHRPVPREHAHRSCHPRHDQRCHRRRRQPGRPRDLGGHHHHRGCHLGRRRRGRHGDRHGRAHDQLDRGDPQRARERDPGRG